MPVIPPIYTAPYPTANQVLNRARAISNDAAQTIAGNLLANSQPYTIEDLNKAYEDVQYELGIHGYEAMITESVIESIPVAASSIQTDPGVQLWMAYDAFYDGDLETPTPVLPNDMMIPLRLWERQHGTLQNFYQMYPVNDGLPSTTRTSNLRCWDWLNNKIYLVGALQVQDIRMRYVRRLDAVVDGDSIIPLPDSKNAIANRVVYTFALARGSALAATFKADSDQAVEEMVTRTSRKKQRGNHRRIGYGRKGSSGSWQCGY